MNLIDPHRSDLLEDLFSESSSPPLNQLLAAIHREKLRRASRQRALALGTSLVILVAVGMFLSRLPLPTLFSKPARLTALRSTTPTGLPQEPFRVERVDDEGLLNLLGHTPAAVVHWPNGRRALMLLVQTPPQE